MEASSRALYSASLGVELSSSRSLRYATPWRLKLNSSPNSTPANLQRISWRSRGPGLLRTKVATDDPTSDSAEAAEEKDDESINAAAQAKVEESVSVLKTAAKTKKVPPTEVFAAIRSLEKARIDSSNFLETIGGKGTTRCWMLVFTAGAKVVQEALRGGAGGGGYFPVTAVQQYNAATKEIQNGVYLGPLGALEFMGRFSMTKNRLYFMFDTVSLKLGSLGPFKFNIGKKEDEGRELGKKDPFFIWFYADDEIVVGKGRGGGVAVWVRCKRVSTST